MTVLLIMRDHHYGRLCFKSFKTLYILRCENNVERIGLYHIRKLVHGNLMRALYAKENTLPLGLLQGPYSRTSYDIGFSSEAYAMS